MIVICENCSVEYKTVPSWHARTKHHYCGRPCFMEATLEKRSKEIAEAGKGRRFTPGENRYPNKTYHKGKEHSGWKGQKAGYRALHYWLRRVRGSPPGCQLCGNAKGQWANIDGKYRRNADDFISLCSSCHKNYDIAIKAASLGAPYTTLQ